MYRTCFILSVIIPIAVLRNTNQDIFHFPPSFADKHAEMVQRCIKEAKVSSKIFEKAITWEVTEDEATKKFVYCFGIGLKVADENGHAIVDNFVPLLGKHPRFNEFKNVVAECNKATGKDPEDTLFLVGKCINEEGPIAFRL